MSVTSHRNDTCSIDILIVWLQHFNSQSRVSRHVNTAECKYQNQTLQAQLVLMHCAKSNGYGAAGQANKQDVQPSSAKAIGISCMQADALQLVSLDLVRHSPGQQPRGWQQCIWLHPTQPRDPTPPALNTFKVVSHHVSFCKFCLMPLLSLSPSLPWIVTVVYAVMHVQHRATRHEVCEC